MSNIYIQTCNNVTIPYENMYVYIHVIVYLIIFINICINMYFHDTNILCSHFGTIYQSKTLFSAPFRWFRTHLLLQGIRPLDIQVRQLPPPRRCLVTAMDSRGFQVTQVKSLGSTDSRCFLHQHHRYPGLKIIDVIGIIDIQGDIHRYPGWHP